VASTIATPINATIPAAAQAGTGYRIRITSSNPAVTGANNGTNLTIGAYPTVSFTNILNGLSVQFINNSTGGNSWAWDFGDGNSSTLQNPSHTYATEDTFIVCLSATGTAGCTQFICDSVVTVQPFGFEESSPDELFLFPNPADEIIHLSFESSPAERTIDLLSCEGKQIQTFSISAGTQTISLWVGNLKPGLYLIRSYESGKTSLHKFVRR
jgi:PKD repeat protein